MWPGCSSYVGVNCIKMCGVCVQVSERGAESLTSFLHPDISILSALDVSPPQNYATLVINICKWRDDVVDLCAQMFVRSGRCESTEGVIWRKQRSEETSSAKRNVSKQTRRTSENVHSPPKEKKKHCRIYSFYLFPVMSERALACFYSLDHLKIIPLFQLWFRWWLSWCVKRSQMLPRWVSLLPLISH